MTKQKKFVLSALSVAVLVSAGYVGYREVSNEGESDLLLTNVEALTCGEKPGNTGLGELYDCPWPFTGDGKICKSSNSYPCTDIPCK